MPAPLLTTKYHWPPAPAGHAPRSRLTSRLDEVLALGRRLALVAAPAGSGKTTLVRAWLGQIAPEQAAPSRPVCAGWFTVDEADNDLAAFLAYLSAALQAAHPEAGPEWCAALAPDAAGRLPPLKPALSEFLNRAAELPGQTVLVIDDYHLISAPAVHESVTFLLDHLPETLRLVIATRAESLLPLSRLRARGQLVEVREADLRFDAAEAAKLLNEQMGLKLDQPQVMLLTQHTEGWAAGLQMAALALRGFGDSAEQTADFIRTFSGSHRFVLDYLMDEVFSRLPQATQTFLLDTSVLNRFCAELCAALRPEDGAETAHQRLLALSQANLFLIPLDEERRWFRYHHLFADLLRNRLRQVAAPDEIAALHGRASAWFAAAELPDEAIHHALLAGDVEQAAGLVQTYLQPVMSTGRLATVQGWLAALPPAVVQERPRLRVYQAWVAYMAGDAATALRILEETRHALDRLADSRDLQKLKHELLSILAVSNLPAGDARRVIDLTQEALEQVPESELNIRARLLFAQGLACGFADDARAFPLLAQARDHARRAGNHYLTANILFNEAFARMTFMLQLRPAWQLYQEIVDMCTPKDGGRPSAPAGVGLVGQAGIAVEWNDLEAAARLLEQGWSLCRQGGFTTTDFYAFLAQARLAQARGDPAGAAAALDGAASHGSIISHQMTAAQLIEARVRLCLGAGQPEAAARWARGDEWPLPPGLSGATREIVELAQVRVLIAQGQPAAALARLDALLPQADAVRRTTHLLEGCLLQALARQALRQDALPPLARALGLGQPQGVTRLFLEAGAPLQSLLLACRPKLGDLTPEADRLLGLFGQPGEATPAGNPVERPLSLIEPLSPREMDVLRLLYAGKSNQEIASALYLSLSAIKKHTGNIYGKLGVSSRAQAIARARELRLV